MLALGTAHARVEVFSLLNMIVYNEHHHRPQNPPAQDRTCCANMCVNKAYSDVERNPKK